MLLPGRSPMFYCLVKVLMLKKSSKFRRYAGFGHFVFASVWTFSFYFVFCIFFVFYVVLFWSFAFFLFCPLRPVWFRPLRCFHYISLFVSFLCQFRHHPPSTSAILSFVSDPLVASFISVRLLTPPITALQCPTPTCWFPGTVLMSPLDAAAFRGFDFQLLCH